MCLFISCLTYAHVSNSYKRANKTIKKYGCRMVVDTLQIPFIILYYDYTVLRCV